MKAPAALDAAIARFDRLSLRERVLIFGALLAAVLTLWQSAVMDPLSLREKSLSQELSTLQAGVEKTSRATESLASSDPTTLAMTRLQEKEAALKAIDARLASESAGLIAPSKMVEVIHDVLSHQQGLVLVSLRNLPVSSLAPEPKPAAGAAAATAAPAAPAAPTAGPYLHPVEIVLEGRYLDVVSYLHALEALPWHFYWKVLELETKTYPLNRVRIELSTVSLDKEWIGV